MQKLCRAAPKVLKVGWQALEGRVVRHPQSKFEGSDRQIRGRVVEALRKKKHVTPQAMYSVIPAKAGIQDSGFRVKPGMTRRRLQKVLKTLLRDGLIIKKGSKFMLPK